MRKIFENIKPATLCFFTGDAFTTIFYLLFGGEITHFLLKAVGTLIIGVIGGLAGLAGKDLYPILKKLIKKYFIKLFKIKNHE